MRLSDHLAIPHLSTGEMLRQTCADTPLGRLVASYINNGRLAPDFLVVPIITKRLAEPDCHGGCLFDGFPRTVNQASLLDEYLADLDARLDVVLNLQVDSDQLRLRLLKRAEVEGRVDDTDETIQARLEVFRSQTAPVLDYYQRQGIVRGIDGMRSPDDVFTDILTCLGS